MKRLVLCMALMAGAAIAQPPGSGDGVAAAIGAGINQPVPGAALGQTLGTVNSSVRTIDESARESARAASDRAMAGGRVEAKAGVRVDRGTRCYDTRGDFDAWERDGYYYCERSGVAAGAKVKAGG